MPLLSQSNWSLHITTARSHYWVFFSGTDQPGVTIGLDSLFVFILFVHFVIKWVSFHTNTIDFYGVHASVVLLSLKKKKKTYFAKQGQWVTHTAWKWHASDGVVWNGMNFKTELYEVLTRCIMWGTYVFGLAKKTPVMTIEKSFKITSEVLLYPGEIICWRTGEILEMFLGSTYLQHVCVVDKVSRLALAIAVLFCMCRFLS